MRSVKVTLLEEATADEAPIYRLDFYVGDKNVGHWPTDGLWLSKYIGDWLVDGSRPQ